MANNVSIQWNDTKNHSREIFSHSTKISNNNQSFKVKYNNHLLRMMRRIHRHHLSTVNYVHSWVRSTTASLRHRPIGALLLPTPPWSADCNLPTAHLTCQRPTIALAAFPLSARPWQTFATPFKTFRSSRVLLRNCNGWLRLE